MIMKRVAYDDAPVVELSDLKAHLRVSGNDSDLIIAQLERAAVSYLDGYRGALGRCINEQTWEWGVRGYGTHRLPLPDVKTLTGATWNGGPCIETQGDATVLLTCQMPEDKLATVQAAICLWVQIRYDGLEGASVQAFQAAMDSLIQSARWVR